jgi:hypothetical protein
MAGRTWNKLVMLLPLIPPVAHHTKMIDPTSSSLYSYSLGDMTYESEGLPRSDQLDVQHMSFEPFFDVRSRVVWGVKNRRGEGLPRAGEFVVDGGQLAAVMDLATGGFAHLAETVRAVFG